ncbi:MAG: V-type ATP synthase subunit D [Oscillospiraceae bacterium]
MAQQVFPTKGNLISSKKSLSLAKLGFELLDRKRNVLMREMMKLIDETAALQKDIGNTFSTAYDALQKASIIMGIDNISLEKAPIENGFVMQSHSVMGVDLPNTALEKTSLRMPFYGFNGTSAELDKAVLNFEKVKELTARLAGVDNSVYRLVTAIKKTQRRANVLDEGDIAFITGALEERDREEFTRLKVIKRVKLKK